MQRPGSPSSFVELASGHSPAWDATERQMATEDREMKEFIARNRREIAALTDGHHTVSSAVAASAYGDPSSVVDAAMRGPERRPHEYTLPQLASSFLEEEDPESMHDLHDELEQMKSNAQAELLKLHTKLGQPTSMLQGWSGVAQPSSLLQTDDPDDEDLVVRLEHDDLEQMKAEHAKL